MANRYWVVENSSGWWSDIRSWSETSGGVGGASGAKGGIGFILNAIPIMTSNTEPNGVCSGSSFYDPSAEYFGAFSQSTYLNGWLSSNGDMPCYIQYQFTSAKTISLYQLIPWSVDNFPSRSPKTWKFQLNPPPVSLFHFNGNDNSTIFTDEMGKIWTYTGTSHIHTDNKRFGNACLALDGDSDNLVGPSEDIDFDFGTGDYTIDCWVYLNSNDYSTIIEGRSTASYQNYIFGIYNLSGTHRLDLVDSSSRFTGTSTSVPLLIWTHVAWVRSSGVVMCFVNGNKDVTTRSYSSNFNMTRSNMLIGRNVDGNFLNGYIDELCISKGVARWTESFTPPIKPYSIIKPYKNHLVGCRSRTGDSGGIT